MKKSTVLLLAVVYIVSFLIIGLLGHSIRNYDPVYYPESIELSDPDNKTNMSKDVKDPDTGVHLYDYYFVFLNYSAGMSMRVHAEVKPDNCTYPNVTFTKDEKSSTNFDIATHTTNANIEEGYCVITLNETTTTGQILSAPFLVTATNPGTQIKIKACITFVCA